MHNEVIYYFLSLDLNRRSIHIALRILNITAIDNPNTQAKYHIKPALI
jgi:hypothetical protein